MVSKDLGMTGAFKNRKTEHNSQKVKKPLSTGYKSTQKPQTSFENLENDLLKNVELANEKELLSSVNKSIVIPASVWCDFHAVLYSSDNDYSYELLDEMMTDYIKKNKLDKDEEYADRKQMLEKDELKKIKKKKIKKKR